MQLHVNECFNSIQGEGMYTGFPATFLRLQGCNVGCHFCFGRSTNHRTPKLHLAKNNKHNKKHVSLSNANIGDVILTYDDNLNVVETTITETHKKTVQQYYEIYVGHTKTVYRATGDHPIFTERGIVQVKDLIPGDMILHSSRIKLVDYYNPEYRIEASKKKLGHLNPNYNGGGALPVFSAMKKKAKQLCGTKCPSCGVKKNKFHVHHIDENQQNDTEDNMIIICSKCHNKLHKRGYNFWKKPQKNGKERLTSVLAANGIEVIKTKLCNNKLEVFNITCCPYNTYFLDRMWVHNCDTKYAQHLPKNGPIEDNRPAYEWDTLSVEEVIKDLTALNTTRLIITGGEPFLQAEAMLELINLLPKEMPVHIETSGTVHESDYVHAIFSKNNVAITLSPKQGTDYHYLIAAREVKLLVPADGFNPEPETVEHHAVTIKRPQWFRQFQPIWYKEEYLRDDSMYEAIQATVKYNGVLSVQTHKLIGVR